MCLAHGEWCDLESHICYQVSKNISYHFFISQVHPGYMSKRELTSAPLKDMAQAFEAKIKEAAWAVWLQAEELTICTRSIQSNTQISQLAKFPEVHDTYVHNRGDLMYLLILRISQSSNFSVLYSSESP